MHEDGFCRNELNQLEQRLAAWAPTTEGLDMSATLFAAGRASVGANKAVNRWRSATVCLAAITIALSAGLAWERTHGPAPSPTMVKNPAVPAVDSAPHRPLASASYLMLRRRFDESPDARLIESPTEAQVKSPAVVAPPIPRAWNPGGPDESF